MPIAPMDVPSGAVLDNDGRGLEELRAGSRVRRVCSADTAASVSHRLVNVLSRLIYGSEVEQKGKHTTTTASCITWRTEPVSSILPGIRNRLIG